MRRKDKMPSERNQMKMGKCHVEEVPRGLELKLSGRTAAFSVGSAKCVLQHYRGKYLEQ